MAPSLPAVEVTRKTIDEAFDPHTPVLVLRWADHGPSSERLWELPGGLSVLGTPPRKFALYLRRLTTDSYAVRMLWEESHLSWPALSRLELLSSSLSALLAALGLDLWSMLEQPIPGGRLRPRAA